MERFLKKLNVYISHETKTLLLGFFSPKYRNDHTGRFLPMLFITTALFTMTKSPTVVSIHIWQDKKNVVYVYTNVYPQIKMKPCHFQDNRQNLDDHIKQMQSLSEREVSSVHSHLWLLDFIWTHVCFMKAETKLCRGTKEFIGGSRVWGDKFNTIYSYINIVIINNIFTLEKERKPYQGIMK